jgi:hypothetical protein
VANAVREATLFFGLLSVGFFVAGCRSDPPPPAADASVGIVTLLIQSDDGSVHSIEVDDVADGSTLESVMSSVEQIPVEMSGSGLNAFVESIGGISTDSSQGWTFKIDGEFANQGIGQTVLHPPTTVQWSFGEFEM